MWSYTTGSAVPIPRPRRRRQLRERRGDEADDAPPRPAMADLQASRRQMASLRSAASA
uniref:Uncharacterized protein n=1 Tax=Setaria italica TaxID=4555 RepID=A0A0Q3SK19_SETIT